MSLPNFDGMEITSIEDIVRAVRPHIDAAITIIIEDNGSAIFSLKNVPTRKLTIQPLLVLGRLVLDVKISACDVLQDHMVYDEGETLVDYTYQTLATVRAWWRSL